MRKLTLILASVLIFAVILPLTFNMLFSSKGSTATLVGVAYATGLKSATTKIGAVKFTIGGVTHEVSASGQSITVEANQTLTKIYVGVYIGFEYAVTGEQANDRTRVTFKLTAPNSTVVYNQILPTTSWVINAVLYWIVQYEDTVSFILTEGTWNWEAKYEIFVL